MGKAPLVCRGVHPIKRRRRSIKFESVSLQSEIPILPGLGRGAARGIAGEGLDFLIHSSDATGVLKKLGGMWMRPGVWSRQPAER